MLFFLNKLFLGEHVAVILNYLSMDFQMRSDKRNSEFGCDRYLMIYVIDNPVPDALHYKI